MAESLLLLLSMVQQIIFTTIHIITDTTLVENLDNNLSVYSNPRHQLLFTHFHLSYQVTDGGGTELSL